MGKRRRVGRKVRETRDGSAESGNGRSFQQLARYCEVPDTLADWRSVAPRGSRSYG